MGPNIFSTLDRFNTGGKIIHQARRDRDNIFPKKISVFHIIQVTRFHITRRTFYCIFTLTLVRSNSFPIVYKRVTTYPPRYYLTHITFQHIIIFIVPSRGQNNTTDTPTTIFSKLLFENNFRQYTCRFLYVSILTRPSAILLSSSSMIGVLYYIYI